MRRLPPEVLGNTSISIKELVDDYNPHLLMVSMEDVHTCHRLSRKIGEKWSEVLQRRGYSELADVALAVSRGKCYLEEQDVSSPTLPTRKETTAGYYTTPHSALRGVRRYPPDCDGSGLPTECLPNLDCHHDSSAAATAREAIQQIDELAQIGDMTYWEYGWDGILEAVARNRERIKYTSLNASNVGTYNDDTATVKDNMGGSGGREKRGERRKAVVRFNIDDEIAPYEGKNADGIAHGCSILKRRRVVQQETHPHHLSERYVVDTVSNCNTDDLETKGCNETEYQEHATLGEYARNGGVRGRPPSSIGEETFRWDSVLEVMTMEERRSLIVTAIHPPYPYESDMERVDNEETALIGDDNDERPVICGALKDVGQIHLWEQTRHFSKCDNDDDDDGPSEDEAEEGRMPGSMTMYGATVARASLRTQERTRRQKRAMTRATKERLGRRIVSINEHSVPYAKAASCSKVRWTEDDDTRMGRESTPEGSSIHRSVESPLPPPRGTRAPRRWLDMDLGECTIELLVDGKEGTEPCDDVGGGNSERTKQIVAFRSLEVGLMN